MLLPGRDLPLGEQHAHPHPPPAVKRGGNRTPRISRGGDQDGQRTPVLRRQRRQGLFHDEGEETGSDILEGRRGPMEYLQNPEGSPALVHRHQRDRKIKRLRTQRSQPGRQRRTSRKGRQ